MPRDAEAHRQGQSSRYIVRILSTRGDAILTDGAALLSDRLMNRVTSHVRSRAGVSQPAGGIAFESETPARFQ